MTTEIIIADIHIKAAQIELNELMVRQAKELAAAKVKVAQARIAKLDAQQAERPAKALQYEQAKQKQLDIQAKAKAAADKKEATKSAQNEKISARLQDLSAKVPQEELASATVNENEQISKQLPAAEQYRRDLCDIVYEHSLDLEILDMTVNEFYDTYYNELSRNLDQRWNEMSADLMAPSFECPIDMGIYEPSRAGLETFAEPWLETVLDNDLAVLHASNGDIFASNVIAYINGYWHSLGCPDSVPVQCGGIWYNIRVAHPANDRTHHCELSFLDTAGREHCIVMEYTANNAEIDGSYDDESYAVYDSIVSCAA
ncbi:hypothetical protein SELR_pSRC500100 (plasmid) [Selenomonas ruminantium subsp. lactilytica TAM6421]|uniref:Uncharacterized protein n=1 Tax=Selenomonas ruminantium subsp. lactilytica (strain NBRC 103574 / TAM6421) TaxID=927704 RepID=I0GWP7_SELRL|nr:hypothetical protein [Selenomonas ruminantium]BAL85184.1 hypothetical protein SELR_pSRC500100 [Selenomonas ruminantium subsp. lactilytica TAM6421]